MAPARVCGQGLHVRRIGEFPNSGSIELMHSSAQSAAWSSVGTRTIDSTMCSSRRMASNTAANTDPHELPESWVRTVFGLYQMRKRPALRAYGKLQNAYGALALFRCLIWGKSGATADKLGIRERRTTSSTNERRSGQHLAGHCQKFARPFSIPLGLLASHTSFWCRLQHTSFAIYVAPIVARLLHQLSIHRLGALLGGQSAPL